MEQVLLSTRDLEARWGITDQTINKMVKEGEIKPVKAFGHNKFNINQILKIEESGTIDPLSPLERRRLELEIKNRDAKILKYETILANIFACMGEYMQYMAKKE